jgi:hypothetical protein
MLHRLHVFHVADVLAQEPTPGSGDVFITITYPEQVNIRNGPSTFLYDIIGNMQPGETAKALGVSPGRDWVEIVFELKCPTPWPGMWILHLPISVDLISWDNNQ